MRDLRGRERRWREKVVPVPIQKETEKMYRGSRIEVCSSGGGEAEDNH